MNSLVEVQRRIRTMQVLLASRNCKFRRLLDETPPKCASQKHAINSADTYEEGGIAEGEEVDTTNVSPLNIENIFSGVEDFSKGNEVCQPHSKGVLDWGIGTPT